MPKTAAIVAVSIVAGLAIGAGGTAAVRALTPHDVAGVTVDTEPIVVGSATATPRHSSAPSSSPPTTSVPRPPARITPRSPRATKTPTPTVTVVKTPTPTPTATATATPTPTPTSTVTPVPEDTAVPTISP